MTPESKHTVLDWSDDLEMLEITSPAEYGTRRLTAAETGAAATCLGLRR